MGFITGCVGAIDGLLIPLKGQGKDRTFYCRKGFHAMNIQGIADVHGRIIYALVGSTPGSAHDSFAWKQAPLCAKMRDDGERIATWMKEQQRHLIGDDAYPSGHTMAVPWPGSFDATSPKLAYNFVHSSSRMAIERAFGMLCRKWLLLKRPYEGSLRRTNNSAGYTITITVAMKLHNLAIASGGSNFGHLYGSDVSGERDPIAGASGAEGREQRDYLGRARAVDTSTILTASPNPTLAQVEAARGEKQAAERAAMPAWEEGGSGRSPRDPLLGKKSPCEPREQSTQHLSLPTDTRQVATEAMEAFGYTRKSKVHWK